MKSTYEVHGVEYGDHDQVTRQAGAGINIRFGATGNSISASVPTATIAELASGLINQFTDRTPHEFHQFVRILNDAAFYAAIEFTQPDDVESEPASHLTAAQERKLRSLCEKFDVRFSPDDYPPAFDLPAGWVEGWVGGSMYSGKGAWRRTIFVGVEPNGDSHS